MSIYPVRRLGSAGIVPDAYPSDLENLSAFTGGVNVRFKNGQASRAPMFKHVVDLEHEPGHILAIPQSAAGIEEVITVGYDFGSFYSLNGSAWTDVTPSTWSGSGDVTAITSDFLGGVAYATSDTHVPICKRPTDATFVPVPHWPEDDRARVIRAYKDQLIALGVTKTGSFFPTMVKWSNFAYFGDVPDSWDPADPTKSAGENIINGMKHPLVDGAALRDSFVLYCTSSVWLMDFVGGNDIYQFRRVFNDRGIINPNCVVAVGGMHYVFDRDDIYVHDGVTDRSICDERTRKFIFQALDFSKAGRCFVQHDPRLSEVRFSYAADDAYTGFPSASTGCNRQAVYNYAGDTWSFYDFPNIVSSTRAALVTSATWDGDTTPDWGTSGGMWMTTDGDEDRHTLVVGRTDTGMGLTAPRLYGQDLGDGGRLNLPIHAETVKPAVLERYGLDLDALGKHLTQHVNIQALWPQIMMDRASDCYWQVGAANFVNERPSWGVRLTFDPATETKIDVNVAGKYLGYRFVCGGSGDFGLSGFDVQLLVRGRR